MSPFIDLSNKIFFEILQYLPPPDLGNFYCVNKHLYALTAIHRIRYQKKKRKFSTSLTTRQPGSIVRLIKSILADPEIALYVQHINIDGCCRIWDPSMVVEEDIVPRLAVYTASNDEATSIHLARIGILILRWKGSMDPRPQTRKGTLFDRALPYIISTSHIRRYSTFKRL